MMTNMRTVHLGGGGGGMIGNKLVASFVYTFSKLKLSADMYDSFLKNLIEP